MKREQFEHALGAAGAVLGVDEVIVIGSQALYATVDGDLPGLGAVTGPILPFGVTARSRSVVRWHRGGSPWRRSCRST